VDLRSESILHGLEVRAMAVCGHLDAIGEPSGEVLHEVVSGLRIPIADVPARDKLGFGINGGPRPNVATAFSLFVCGNVALFGSNERPDFVALNALASQVAESDILILGTSFAEISQELHYGRAVNAGHASRGAKGITLDQAGNHPSAFFCGNLVHEFKIASMLERSSNIFRSGI